MDGKTLAEFRQFFETRLKMTSDENSGSVQDFVNHGVIEGMDLAILTSLWPHQDSTNRNYGLPQWLIHEIELAIKRIDEGEFGNCCLCSSPIALEILLAEPMAMLCRKCLEAVDALRRQIPQDSGALRTMTNSLC